MESMESFHTLFGISKFSTYFLSTYILGARRGRWNQTEWDQGRIRDRNRPEGAISGRLFERRWRENLLFAT